MIGYCICFGLLVAAAQSAVLRDPVRPAYGEFKPNCRAKVGSAPGCKCEVNTATGVEVREFSNDVDCRLPIRVQTTGVKKQVNNALDSRVAGFREHCVPKSTAGCRCTVHGLPGGKTTVTDFVTDAECRIPTKADSSPFHPKAEVDPVVLQSKTYADAAPFQPRFEADTSILHSKFLAESSPFIAKYEATTTTTTTTVIPDHRVHQEKKLNLGAYKKNCFARKSGATGCTCVEGKDVSGRDLLVNYDSNDQCRELLRMSE